MSRRDGDRANAAKAVALQYGGSDGAPVIVASGMGYMAEKIVETAQQHGVPIYEDNSLATILAQLKLGQEIPEELYKAIVEIYLYFLKFDPNGTDAPPVAPAPPVEQAADQPEEPAAEQPAAEEENENA